MSYFKDKVVWITGASSGIGEALAYAFSKEKAKLILSARKQEVLEKVRENCKGNEENIFVLPFDLNDIDNFHSYTAEVIAHFGRVDVLVNNGGISQRSLAQHTPLEIDRKIMEVNFFSYVALTKSVLPYMISQKAGKIVAISSLVGKFGFHLRSAYAASKHALHGFFDSLRMEVYPHHIKVLLVCPGKIKTNISINAITETGKNYNIMDRSQEKGMPAEVCAEKIIKALKHNKEEIYIGRGELTSVYVKRFFPKLFSRLIRKTSAT